MTENGSRKDLYRALLRIGGAIAGLYAFFFIMGQISNAHTDELPPAESLATALAPPVNTTSTTPPPPLPPGFPSLDRPPPKIEVEPGQPQPIATKFGLTYDIPADWRNGFSAVAGWNTSEGLITFGAIGEYAYDFCEASDGAKLAMTGATGRNGVDIDTAAQEWVYKAPAIFADKKGNTANIAYSQPTEFAISGRPAIRYTATATSIPADNECDPSSATFDIVATSSYATAEVMIFMIRIDDGFKNSLAHGIADQIIATIRQTENPTHG
ncbi:hypothetical protein QM716_26130 [Rhodococcus sp. IEGM 1409]|uniref:hypothetical protein n=1 Tax=Rhodococcus sp. IEGM 1409 TaxID=3047082 RepID=UPI0024B86BF0|nr:hypothetical protein [Rhodococcus sp. IEGM 1409]MDI9903342.1 hypothetical protein [Rhodococcus sp. IEGM 1409]